MMTDRHLLESLVTVLEQERGADYPERLHTNKEIARVALRRWLSFDRRNKVKQPTMEHRIIDLAKGIGSYIERDWQPPMAPASEYRNLAGALAEVLEPGASSDLPHSVTRR